MNPGAKEIGSRGDPDDPRARAPQLVDDRVGQCVVTADDDFAMKLKDLGHFAAIRLFRTLVTEVDRDSESTQNSRTHRRHDAAVTLSCAARILPPLLTLPFTRYMTIGHNAGKCHRKSPDEGGQHRCPAGGVAYSELRGSRVFLKQQIRLELVTQTK